MASSQVHLCNVARHIISCSFPARSTAAAVICFMTSFVMKLCSPTARDRRFICQFDRTYHELTTTAATVIADQRVKSYNSFVYDT
ncbi:hypothetical protein BH18ACI4_BH18ACI4_01640 [soil metagenome]